MKVSPKILAPKPVDDAVMSPGGKTSTCILSQSYQAQG